MMPLLARLQAPLPMPYFYALLDAMAGFMPIFRPLGNFLYYPLLAVAAEDRY